MTTYHPSVRQCVCGHLEADHQSNRAPYPHPLRYGLCLMGDCECREFRDVESEHHE
jgi:hypothetical protein